MQKTELYLKTFPHSRKLPTTINIFLLIKSQEENQK